MNKQEIHIKCPDCHNIFIQRRPDQRFCTRLCKEGKSYRLLKKDTCEDCGFKAIHPCQLDVDHKDGNHRNNNPENLKTLCANCHRLKTNINKEHLKNNNKKTKTELNQ